MKTLELTSKEFSILTRHWFRNLRYGKDGTFRETGKSKKAVSEDIRIAKEILVKMRVVNRKLDF